MRLSYCVGVANVFAWVYLHNPPGSNNRLNEESAAVNNKQRLFRSNNNERGGYNVPDKLAQPAKNAEEQFKYSYFRFIFVTRDDGVKQLNP